MLSRRRYTQLPHGEWGLRGNGHSAYIDKDGPSRLIHSQDVRPTGPPNLGRRHGAGGQWGACAAGQSRAVGSAPGVAVVAMIARAGDVDADLDAGRTAERERRSAGQLPGRGQLRRYLVLLAVGYISGTSTDKTLIQKWNGTSWATLSSPHPGTGSSESASMRGSAARPPGERLVDQRAQPHLPAEQDQRQRRRVGPGQRVDSEAPSPPWRPGRTGRCTAAGCPGRPEPGRQIAIAAPNSNSQSLRLISCAARPSTRRTRTCGFAAQKAGTGTETALRRRPDAQPERAPHVQRHRLPSA